MKPGRLTVVFREGTGGGVRGTDDTGTDFSDGLWCLSNKQKK